jgi:hypothetical protein
LLEQATRTVAESKIADVLSNFFISSLLYADVLKDGGFL